MKAADISVQAWQSDGILLERYSYTAGTVEPLPKHCHEEYQFGFSLNCAGRYQYRGTFHDIPIASLSIIHSGEVHAPSDRTYLPEAATFWMLDLHPKWLQTVATEISEATVDLPFFTEIALNDPWLTRLFLDLHTAANHPNSRLEQEGMLWEFLSYLLTHYAEKRLTTSSIPSARTAVRSVCDYLNNHFAVDISLEQLAEIAGLSRFHFSRVFHKEMGVTPSAYQTQLRIAHAKKLLMGGMAIATVALLTGFYDQSHFGSQFKRHVGVTPGSYQTNTAKISYTTPY